MNRYNSSEALERKSGKVGSGDLHAGDVQRVATEKRMRAGSNKERRDAPKSGTVSGASSIAAKLKGKGHQRAPL